MSEKDGIMRIFSDDVYDAITAVEATTVIVHKTGHVRLVDVMPRAIPEGHTVDYAIAQAARVSYGQGTKKTSEDRTLIRHLMRHHHTSPFEMIETKWHIKLPIFVARQMVRHRTASINEVSGRYSIMKEEFWRPTEVRKQDTKNKQSSVLYDDAELLSHFNDYLNDQERGFNAYMHLTEEGLARELARAGLPLSMYTEWYWKIDLHNLLHFLKLRLAPDAQKEIRDYAEVIYDIMRQLCPITMEAFKDYVLDAITITGPELRALNDEDGWDKHLSKSEKEEFMPKWMTLFPEAGLDAPWVKKEDV